MKKRCTPFISAISLFVACFVTISLQAQSSSSKDSIIENRCVQLLRDAEKTYEAGRINEIEDMILPCIESEGLSKFEKLQGYRLIILSKLFDNQDEAANEYFLKLIKLDPEYQVNPVTDPSEFIQLYNSYRTNPVFAIGAKVGMNLTKPSSFVPYGVSNTAESSGEYTSYFNLQFGANLDVYLTKKWSVGADLLLSFKTYQYKNTLLGYSELTMKENQLWLELPIVLKYTMGQKKLRYYLQAGGAVSMILSSNSNIVRKDAATQSNQAIGPDINTRDLRNMFNYSLVGGGGIRYKAGYGYLVLDVKYMYGLNNISDMDNKYSNDELIYKYGYIDNDFTLNSLMFSIGYYKSFYKPKKLPTYEK
ncbi:porin family protein [Cytophaga hutchinsonii]|uniref:Outer membrane protein beta-barrel domain-containing protein n=1 Tax=Cytophaga hutchinsonii (strain ATCC 33406 / DSM 1761 / CIP 103989 / NBRC 15051 / NCIMB 9469 / D465) TaxID=269798 RepID=A0A6N4SPN6_CYTH3|nr:porin family protein [Cytophaga hutchinsonii]ABG58302.1 hypothetical protein CHU_1025 [Cytophaga hutchinsonii ATCC 33406]SFX52987.1 Outer membrane protein beta-barrel domain-containing protein [Cytophaga hutchinsonii ATCC 33406]